MWRYIYHNHQSSSIEALRDTSLVLCLVAAEELWCSLCHQLHAVTFFVNSLWSSGPSWSCRWLVAGWAPKCYLIQCWILDPHEEISVKFEIQIFSSKKSHLEIPYAEWQPFCSGFNELTHYHREMHPRFPKLCHPCFNSLVLRWFELNFWWFDFRGNIGD